MTLVSQFNVLRGENAEIIFDLYIAANHVLKLNVISVRVNKIHVLYLPFVF